MCSVWRATGLRKSDRACRYATHCAVLAHHGRTPGAEAGHGGRVGGIAGGKRCVRRRWCSDRSARVSDVCAERRRCRRMMVAGAQVRRWWSSALRCLVLMPWLLGRRSGIVGARRRLGRTVVLIEGQTAGGLRRRVSIGRVGHVRAYRRRRGIWRC